MCMVPVVTNLALLEKGRQLGRLVGLAREKAPNTSHPKGVKRLRRKDPES